jgi:hypothetical protein
MTGNWKPNLLVFTSQFEALHLSLFRQLQRILNVNAWIPHGVFQLGMFQQHLDRSNVLGATHSLRPIGCWIETNFFNPRI